MRGDHVAIKRGHIDGADPRGGSEKPPSYRPALVNAANGTELVVLLTRLNRSRLGLATSWRLSSATDWRARPAKSGSYLTEFNLNRAVWTLPATDGRKSAREFRSTSFPAGPGSVGNSQRRWAAQTSLRLPGTKDEGADGKWRLPRAGPA